MIIKKFKKLNTPLWVKYDNQSEMNDRSGEFPSKVSDGILLMVVCFRKIFKI
jgi:hypothetical protein